LRSQRPTDRGTCHDAGKETATAAVTVVVTVIATAAASATITWTAALDTRAARHGGICADNPRTASHAWSCADSRAAHSWSWADSTADSGRGGTRTTLRRGILLRHALRGRERWQCQGKNGGST
jgi:hypothetical protein